MRRRLYFMLPHVHSAKQVVDDLLLARIEARHIHVLAPREVEIGDLPEATVFQKTDLVHGAQVGALVGGLLGAIAGFLLVTFPPGTMQLQLVTVLVLVSVPGTFESGSREAVVAAGLLLAMWLPQVVVPSPLHRIAGTIAGASLYVYLTHFFLYREVRDAHGPWAGFAASLALGIGTWLVVERGGRWVIEPLRPT